MIKSDYGHLSCPFYEQKLKSGLKVLFIPGKAKTESAIVYLSQGGYLHDEKIESSKIPFGTAFYLSEMVMDESFRAKLAQKGAYGEKVSDLSYTYFQVTSAKDIFTPLSMLLERLYNMDFSEEILEGKKDVLSPRNEGLSLAKKDLLLNLYSSSPIRFGVVPDRDQAIPIHVTALKKYLQRYYVPNRVTLIIRGDYTPGECMAKIEKLRLPKDVVTFSKELTFDEDYKNPRVEYASSKSPDGNYLTFGIKFQPRETLYEKFGQLMFFAYEVLKETLFLENPIFLKGIRDVDSDLIDVSFHEGGEDGYLLLSFHTQKPVALLSFLTDYLSKADKMVDRPLFSDVLDGYFAKGIALLRDPHACVQAFSKAYANNLPYTSLLSLTAKMNFRSFKTFLKDFSTFTRSAYFLKRG